MAIEKFNFNQPGSQQGENLHIKGMGVLIILVGVKKAVLVTLRVFSLKRSTAGAFAVPFNVLN